MNIVLLIYLVKQYGSGEGTHSIKSPVVINNGCNYCTQILLLTISVQVANAAESIFATPAVIGWCL